MGKKRVVVGPPKGPEWQASHACYLAGRAYLDAADAMALDMERRWGAGRLRLLVEPELRHKFDRQRVLLNEAITSGGVADVQRESERMCSAYRALNVAAQEAGAKPLASEVWEAVTPGGQVVALVRSREDERAVTASGRQVQVWTLDEVARVLEAFPEIAKAKVIWPGAEVTAVRPIVDPVENWERGDDMPAMGI